MPLVYALACAKSSPLTEGRGLKCHGLRSLPTSNLSPLTEGRGLKWRLVPRERPRVPVAPHGGAWIEIPRAHARR